ncbi:NAD(P)H-dependent flavin oxidoreductase [Limnohabitans sp.]|uniref:NAD(P)H-dependent flavin oxidoreductase n=1 Tax=Limnohabitans sp. TaxID=1907725 RepID=UPI0039BC498F|nr:nitronate monooxygenase [Comamonadaceae bacterium]
MQIKETFSFRVPVIAAPMFLVSGIELVVASVNAGIVGAFPTLNARTPALLDAWLSEIKDRTHGASGLVAANLILHPSNGRRDDDLDIVINHRVPWVITSVGSPGNVVGRIHAYGGRVLADVATVRHARKAIEAGVDMLVLLTAGAGGNTGWINPFAFIEEVRSFWAGPLAVAGCVTTGRQVRAVQMAGADMAYMGTPFIATPESMASQDYKEALVAAGADDIVKTDAVTGIPANFLKSSLLAQGIMQADGSLLPKGASDLASWKTAWSAGQGVASVGAVETVADRVEKLHQEWIKAADVVVR